MERRKKNLAQSVNFMLTKYPTCQGQMTIQFFKFKSTNQMIFLMLSGHMLVAFKTMKSPWNSFEIY